MPTPRVVIDLNSVDEDGETVVFLSDVHGGSLQKGFMVQAFEPEDKLCAPARVASIREDLGIAFLQVDWRSIRRDAGTVVQYALDKRGWIESASRTASTHLTTTLGNTKSVSLRRPQNAAL